MKVLFMPIASKLKKIRKELNLSPEKLANILTKEGFKINSKTISGYENGHRQPSYQYLNGLTAVFLVDPMYLFIDSENIFIDKKEKTIKENNYIELKYLTMNKKNSNYKYFLNSYENAEYIKLPKKLYNFNCDKVLNYLLIRRNSDFVDDPFNKILLCDMSINNYFDDGLYLIAMDDNIVFKKVCVTGNNEYKIISEKYPNENFHIQETDIISQELNFFSNHSCKQRIKIICKILCEFNKNFL